MNIIDMTLSDSSKAAICYETRRATDFGKASPISLLSMSFHLTHCTYMDKSHHTCGLLAMKRVYAIRHRRLVTVSRRVRERALRVGRGFAFGSVSSLKYSSRVVDEQCSKRGAVCLIDTFVQCFTDISSHFSSFRRRITADMINCRMTGLTRHGCRLLDRRLDTITRNFRHLTGWP